MLAERKPWRDLKVRNVDEEGEIEYTSSEPLFDVPGVFDGYLGVARLMTDRCWLEAQLRESEAKCRALTALS